MNLFENINFSKLKEGLSKTRTKIVNTINETITGKAVLDDKTLDEIEEILITSDIGFETSGKIIESARERLHREKDRTKINILESVKKELVAVLKAENKNGDSSEIQKYKPYVILIVGVNGAGKTTTIGKLAHNFKQAGLRVIVGAADTFRAAANEQLDIWADRAGVEIVRKDKGADPSSVAFETIQRAVREKYDIVLIDTAGRLHNKAHLMEELNKIKRVSGKVVEYAPNETLLVLDGTTGQNAVIQAEEFSKVTDISGLVITKLDGTAKGGVVFQICSRQRIPVKYIGVGEAIDDLQTFDPDLFVSAIFEN
ncbi:MAG TPA: signal recognition particle-docking protein FtsY [Ignavibacteriaceae bacterium]|jgi:fused signal recognition particle receptor|nr:signal recognition particle-docking protein FtsY [Ignavibacteriaceae bacterium]